ncbi:MAG: hypothetical protein WBJ52_09225 [Methanoregulaceae archaeon]
MEREWKSHVFFKPAKFLHVHVDTRIDEWGDIGSGLGSSPFFVVAGLFVRETPQIKRCSSKIMKSHPMKKYRDLPGLRFNYREKASC